MTDPELALVACGSFILYLRFAIAIGRLIARNNPERSQHAPVD